jgi:hypothetical protein
MDTPHSWVVQAVQAVYDLDNILLKDMGKERYLSATFELQHILAEGTPPHPLSFPVLPRRHHVLLVA